MECSLGDCIVGACWGWDQGILGKLHIVSDTESSRNEGHYFTPPAKLLSVVVYVLGDQRYGQEIFLFSKMFRPALGPTPTFYSVGTQSSFPGDEAATVRADRSPLSIAKVKNKWSYISAPPVWLCGMHRNNFASFYLSRANIPLTVKLGIC
jgi:hypothetical protein